MPNRVLRCWSGAVVLLGVAVFAVACSRGGPTQSHVSSAVVDHFPGAPKGVPPSGCDRAFQTQKPCVAWADAHSIYVITWGSGSCPMIPTSVQVENTREVVVRTVEHDFIKADTACTADLAATTSVVRLPATVGGSKTLLVKVDGTSTRLAVHPA